MCTIIALRDAPPDFPLVIATNRDEFYARRTGGPTRLLEEPVTVGGRDLEARGTWMGVTRAGLFVGVTNQRTYGLPDRTKRSRGELVTTALALAAPDRVLAWLPSLDAREYNGFNLMFGDARALYVAYGREHASRVEVEEVPKGLHVLPNDRLDSADFVKVQRARELLTPFVAAPWSELRVALMRTLADGALPPLEALPDPPPNAPFDKLGLQRLAALCVRTPVYGTRSSTLIALREDGVADYAYADGPPDQTPFADVMGLYADARARVP